MNAISDTTLELFVSTNGICDNVSCRGDIVFATDGQTLCFRQKKEGEDESGAGLKLSDVEGVISRMNLRQTECADALPMYDMQPCSCGGKITEESEDCPDCYGEGLVECSECGYEHDCKTCKGEGRIIKTEQCGVVAVLVFSARVRCVARGMIRSISVGSGFSYVTTLVCASYRA